MKNLMALDGERGEGFTLIDPHGTLAEETLAIIPAERINDVAYFDAGNEEHCFGLNIFHAPGVHHELVASSVLEVIRSLFENDWSATRMQYILANVLATLTETKDSAVLNDVMRLLVDTRFQQGLVRRIENPSLFSFWNEEFLRWPKREKIDKIAPIQNRLGQLLLSSRVRNTLSAPVPKFDFGKCLRGRRILIANLAKPQIGSDAARFLGSLIVSAVRLAASTNGKTPHTIYADEGHLFTHSPFIEILNESRKHGLSLVLAHQNLSQLHTSDRGLEQALFANSAHQIVFKTSLSDSQVFEEAFHNGTVSGYVRAHEIMGLRPHTALVRGDAIPNEDRTAVVRMSPPWIPGKDYTESIKKQSRQRFTRPHREITERERRKKTNTG